MAAAAAVIEAKGLRDGEEAAAASVEARLLVAVRRGEESVSSAAAFVSPAAAAAAAAAAEVEDEVIDDIFAHTSDERVEVIVCPSQPRPYAVARECEGRDADGNCSGDDEEEDGSDTSSRRLRDKLRRVDSQRVFVRIERLTASYFAAAVGLGFASPRSLWEYLTGRLGPQWQGNHHTERGERRECYGKLAYEFCMDSVVSPPQFRMHDRHSWLGACPDGLVGADGLIEIKSPARRAHTHVPRHNMPQLQGELEICEREWVDFTSFTRDHLVVIRVMRSKEYWTWLLPRLQDFYCCLQADVEPTPLARVRDLKPPPVETKLVLDTALCEFWEHHKAHMEALNVNEQQQQQKEEGLKQQQQQQQDIT
eukprot:jgi/Chlat1/5750/Chrsp38S05569